MPTASGDVLAGEKSPSPFPSRIVTLLPLLFATARSGRPSRLKSPTVSDCGLKPTEAKTEKWKPPSPSPSTTVTLFWLAFAVARSGLPSRLKSPTATAVGPSSTDMGDASDGLKSPIPLPSRIVILLLAALIDARSGLPSRLKSLTTICRGPELVASGEVDAGLKSPIPLPSRMVILLEVVFAVARSGLPSRLKSPTATEIGKVPTASGEEPAAVKSAFVQPDSFAPCTLCASADARTRLLTLMPEDSSKAAKPPELHRNKKHNNQGNALRRRKRGLIDKGFISFLPLYSKIA